MTIGEWLKANQGKYADKSSLIVAAVKTLKCSREYALQAYNKVHLSSPISLSMPIAGLSEKELRLKHDNAYKIREGVKKLQKDRYFTDQQMREFCKVVSQAWRGYSEMPEFEKYKIKLSGIIYWGTPECIKKLKEDLNAY